MNTLGSILLLHAGTVSIGREGVEELGRISTLDEAAVAVPARLRGSAGLVSLGRLDAASFAGTREISIIVGFSHRASRLLALLLDSDTNFEPREVHQFSLPSVGLPLELDEHAIVSAAQAQIELLRESYPRLTGGALTVARITPRAVTVESVFDFRIGATATRPIDLSRPAHVMTAGQGAAPRQTETAPEEVRKSASELAQPAEGHGLGLTLAAGKL